MFQIWKKPEDIEPIQTFEKKKQAGLIFTFHNLDPNQPYLSMQPTIGPSAIPLTINYGLSWWDRSKKRYRTAEEQREFEKETLTKNTKANWQGPAQASQECSSEIEKQIEIIKRAKEEKI